MYCYLNNDFIPSDLANISISQRGFKYGDGVFETIIVENSRFYQWNLHLLRLKKSLEYCKLAFDVTILEAIAKELIIKNNLDKGLLRIYVSRGIGSSGYLPDEETKPLLLIECSKPKPVPEYPVDLWVSSYKKIPDTSLASYIKSAQGLNPTLAKIEAKENMCYDSILLSIDNDYITETSSSNIFWVKNELLYTPSLELGVFPGSIRDAVIRLGKDIIEIKEGKYKLEDLKTSDCCFITNVSILIKEVKAIKPLGKNFAKHQLIEELSSRIKEDIIHYSV